MGLAQSHSDWVLGFEDEVWFSRLAQPHLHTWAAEAPLRLVEKGADKNDPFPAAIACYGLLRPDTGQDTDQMLLRFVDGRPVSAVTIAFLDWVSQSLAAEDKKVLVLIWDNASWHISKAVRSWIQGHNRQVKRLGGVRILVCALPSKSPWLNNIEPKWVHGKRATLEPTRKLDPPELRQRLCDYYRCDLLEPLAQQLA
jgi:transposase